MYLILRSLTSLLYVVHMCRGSLTSPLMHCRLCFMWVRILSTLLHVMHVCRGANLPSSSSWMYIAYISLLLICFSPFCWWLTKRERKIFSLNMHIWVFAYNEFMHLTKWEIDFESLNKMGEKVFLENDFGCLHVSLTLLMHIYLFSFMWKTSRGGVNRC